MLGNNDKPKAPLGPTPDELKARLQDSLKRGRPRTKGAMAIMGMAVIGILGLMVYLLYPQTPPPRPILAAMDGLGTSARPTFTTHLQLEEVAEEGRTSRLEGQEIVLWESRLPQPGELVQPIKVRTGPGGRAEAELTFTPIAGQAQYLASLPAQDRQPSVKDQGQIFFPPAEGNLLLVQVQQCLNWIDASRWRTASLSELPAAAGAEAFLREARKRGYQVVYLAVDADSPSLYQRQRGWVRHQMAGVKPAFPPGPVLGRARFGAADALPWEEIAADLKARFTGRLEAVVGTPEAARKMLAAGFSVRQVGAGEEGPGVNRFLTWDDALKGWKE